MNNKRILVVLAHPDDETFICGGILARYAKDGCKITLVCATKGEMGRRVGTPPSLTRETLPILREQELQEACEALGIEDLRFLGLRDKTVEFVDEEWLIGEIVTVIRELQPEAVLTFHELYGGHPDHCAIGKAATAAYHLAGKSDYSPADAPQQQAYEPRHLYFIAFGAVKQHPERFGLRPDQITEVDVSSCAEEKMRAFRAHRSQTELDRGLWDSDKKVIGRFRGKEYLMNGTEHSGLLPDRLF